MREHRLFRRNGNPTFLALIWTAKGNSDLPWSVLELYKVRVISERNVRLKFVRGLKKSYVSIKEISGQDIAGDGVPHLILDCSSGGLWYALSGIRIYRLERNSVDVTPDWAPFFGPRSGLEGYYDACGGSGHAFKTGPILARELAEWILDGSVKDDYRHLSYDRVENDNLFKTTFRGNRQ